VLKMKEFELKWMDVKKEGRQGETSNNNNNNMMLCLKEGQSK
jgi:hypothetical protein